MSEIGSFVAVLSTREFGISQTVIGNTVRLHRPTRWSRLTDWWRCGVLGANGGVVCRGCDYTTPAGISFEYHQADAVIAALHKHCTDTVDSHYDKVLGTGTAHGGKPYTLSDINTLRMSAAGQGAPYSWFPSNWTLGEP